MDKNEKSNEDYNIDFERVKELVSKYEQIKNSGEIKKYNEESTKKDFILPLFEALGWNVYNKGNKDSSVSAEETISKKRVDYGFRINGIPKFFLEAKSLKEDDIQNNPKYVTQAIDYAWMKSCSWAILTNFETIGVYNADWKSPYFNGNLFFILHPNDFLTDDRFRKFSKEAFQRDELDDLASKFGKKQVKNHIDKQLLLDMIGFREILSKDIVKNNQDKHLTQDDIDESVQRILDRLIFIRNAEDRGLEENQLQSNVRQWYSRGKGHLLKEISRIYADFDRNYNSKLFSHHLCDDLYEENEALQDVIEGLNHSKDNSYRYDFSIIESDVLGNIYEQYLGNILKSTPKRAKLEESKTHRKEQGIYYTPSYIVDYIVKNTVGEFIKTHTPEEIKKVRILDPACGSGSFLIRAYKELENYWLHNSDFAQTTLDSEEFYSKKVEILKNNIFGVDLDPKAVEIAQLNLLLQISERKQRLPILQNNIKVGNSLIDDPSISDRAFKWEEEFPEVMKEGGFDIVIGNPPYKILTKNNTDLKELQLYTTKYRSLKNSYSKNMFTLFIELGLKLTSINGILSFIVPEGLFKTRSYKTCVDELNSNGSVKKIVTFTNYVFESAVTGSLIFIFSKNSKVETESLFFDKNYNLHKLAYSDDTIIRKMEVKGTVKLKEVCTTFKGMVVQDRGTVISEGQESGNEIFLLGKSISKWSVGQIYYTDYKKLVIVGGTKRREMYNHVPRILIRRTGNSFCCTLLERMALTESTIYSCWSNSELLDNKYLIALLNSKLFDYYLKKLLVTNVQAFPQILMTDLEELPIKIVSIDEQKQIIALVDRIFEVTQNTTYSHNQFKKDMVERFEKEIDDLVYKIYYVNEEEKKRIEESLK